MVGHSLVRLVGYSLVTILLIVAGAARSVAAYSRRKMPLTTKLPQRRARKCSVSSAGS